MKGFYGSEEGGGVWEMQLKCWKIVIFQHLHFVFYNSFMENWFTDHTIHLFKVYIPVILVSSCSFSTLLTILEHFYPHHKNPIPLSSHCSLPQRLSNPI